MSTGAPTSAPTAASVFTGMDTLLVFDFLDRWAVDRCGAAEAVSTAVLSLVVIASLLVWVVLFVLVWFRPELYVRLVGTGLTLLTVIVVGLVFAFDRPPPVPGCGMEHSWPSPYTALAGYLSVLFFRYSVDIAPQPFRMRMAAVLVLVLANHSVMYIGTADGPGALAGACVGMGMGFMLHEMVMGCSVNPAFYDFVRWGVEVANLWPKQMSDTIIAEVCKRNAELEEEYLRQQKELQIVNPPPLHMGIQAGL
jgi:hypothetical protein